MFTSCTMLFEFRRSFFFEGFMSSTVCLSCKSNNYVRMSVEQWWSDTDGEEQSAGRRSQWQLHLIYHKCHSGTKPMAWAVRSRWMYWAMHVHLRQVNANCIWRSSPYRPVNTQLWIQEISYSILIFPAVLHLGKYTWRVLCIFFQFAFLYFDRLWIPVNSG